MRGSAAALHMRDSAAALHMRTDPRPQVTHHVRLARPQPAELVELGRDHAVAAGGASPLTQFLGSLLARPTLAVRKNGWHT
jgi:hypothetical protein